MMIKNIVYLHNVVRTGPDEPAVGTWLRMLRTVSAAVRGLVSWPASVYRARRDMEQLGRMSERDLTDIGLTRQDLYDMQALPLGRPPTAMLGLRVYERKPVGRHRALSRAEPWRF